MNRYLEIFNLLDYHCREATVNESFAQLGGIVRDLPLLDGAIIDSCHISHYLANDLEQKWIRAFHVALSSSLTKELVQERFRAIASKDLVITFTGKNKTMLCTKFSREVITVEAFAEGDKTKVFVSSQLSGFDQPEALNFLINPLGDLNPGNNLEIRLVSVRSSRPSIDGKGKDRILEQRWTTSNVDLAIQNIITSVDRNRWLVEQNLLGTDSKPKALLRHVPSADLICLNSVMGYEKLELQARLQS